MSVIVKKAFGNVHMTRRMIFFMTATAWVLSAFAGESSLNRLVDDNPFLPYAPSSAPSEPRLEFRGIVYEDGVARFSVRNLESNRSTWMHRDENVNGFSVSDYDAQNDVLVLKDAKRSLRLPLKQAKIKLMASAQMPVNEDAQIAAGVPPRLTSEQTAPLRPLSDAERADQVMNAILQRQEARRKSG